MTGVDPQLEAVFWATVELARKRAGKRVPVIGIAGAQGSGKTFLAQQAARASGAVALSLDDFYLGFAARQRLAAEIHPLFATRGVPGTHDLDLWYRVMSDIQRASDLGGGVLPIFDKVADERREIWRPFEGRPPLVVVDGWCLGGAPQAEADLAAPVNELEAMEDQAGVWRRHANAMLGAPYQAAFGCIDAILHLRAPSFLVVQAWRCEQEEGLLGRSLDEADRARIARFIQHFERITRHMLAGGRRADLEVELAPDRGVVAVRGG